MNKKRSKKALSAAVEANYNEMADVITTIIGAVSAKGQRKKILENPEVQKILERYGLDIPE